MSCLLYVECFSALCIGTDSFMGVLPGLFCFRHTGNTHLSLLDSLSIFLNNLQNNLEDNSSFAPEHRCQGCLHFVLKKYCYKYILQVWL